MAMPQAMMDGNDSSISFAMTTSVNGMATSAKYGVLDMNARYGNSPTADMLRRNGFDRPVWESFVVLGVLFVVTLGIAYGLLAGRKQQC